MSIDPFELTHRYLTDDRAWPLGSSGRVWPAVRGFVDWLNANGYEIVTKQPLQSDVK